jgi:CBS domain-containing protein
MNISRKLISAVMTRDVFQLGVDCSALDALTLMRERKVSSVLVTEEQMILGIITERDIVRALHAGRDVHALGVVDLMQSPVVTVQTETRCLDAYHLMTSRGIRHLVITDERGRVQGVASEGDVMRNFGVEYYMNFKDVGSVMTREFCRLAATATVADAIAEMVEKRQSCVVVVDSLGRPGGVLTERDVVRLCMTRANPATMPLRKAMHSPVITVNPRRRLHTAVKAMEAAHIRRLIVVDAQGVACGLLTHHEVARGLEGDYASYLKEIVSMQARNLEQATQAIDEKLLLANVLRSVTGTSVLACDLEYRITYATPSIEEVLGLPLDDLGGSDLRAMLKRVGWHGAPAALGEDSVANGARTYAVDALPGRTEFQVSVLLDPQRQAVGYLVLARRLPMRRSTAAAPVLRADPFAAVAANDVG